MFKKALALMLVLTMLFSLAACKSSSEEQEALAGELTEDNSDTVPNSNNENSNNNNEDGNTDQTPNDSSQQPSTNEGDNKQDESTPPPQGEGKYTVTFNFGYDSKKETEKTDGKVTKMDALRDGFTFDGWFDGDTRFDFSKEITADTTLTAKWSAITYTIAYKAEGATLPTGNPTTYTAENEIKLASPTMPGKIFLGWSIDDGKSSITSMTIPKGTTGNLTLTPVWDENAFIYGKYEQDGNPDNGSEDIVWIKLKEENGKTMYISKYILDAKQYDVQADYIKWASCTLRKWLNESFYKSAFTPEEKAAILQTEVKTPGQHDGSTSNDYIYLLSIEEAKELLSSNLARKAELTKHAEANGAQNSFEGGWWWLRTKVGPYSAALIENTGNIRDIGYNGKMTTIGIRPVMWIDNSKLG
ncbi:MAG: InlB B-repeat-containing protein [Clostridia bacterium]|nr:InlB B-repeat-containing protein [Clostridia bacterium]